VKIQSIMIVPTAKPMIAQMSAFALAANHLMSKRNPKARPHEKRVVGQAARRQEDAPSRFVYAQAHRARLGRGNETGAAIAKRPNLSRRLTWIPAHRFNLAVMALTVRMFVAAARRSTALVTEPAPIASR
jgi:hypothetical protein